MPKPLMISDACTMSIASFVADLSGAREATGTDDINRNG